MLAALSRAVRNTGLARTLPYARPLGPRLAPAIFGARHFAEFLDRDSVTNRVLGVVKSFDKVDAAKVTEKSHFVTDLGLDSLDTVEVVMCFEDEFALEIDDKDAEKIMTCEDAINFICAHPQAK